MGTHTTHKGVSQSVGVPRGHSSVYVEVEERPAMPLDDPLMDEQHFAPQQKPEAQPLGAQHVSLDEAPPNEHDDGNDITRVIADAPAPSTGGRSDGPPTSGGPSEGASDPDADRTTELQTYMHLLKGNVGPGCLSLPWAVSVLGIPLMLLTLLGLCIITTFNCWAIVRWKRRHGGGAASGRALTYADLGEMAYGPRFRSFVVFCVCATQLAVCTVFLSFIGENISSVLRNVAPGTPLDSSRAVVVATLPMVMLLSFAPNLRVLAPATAAGMALLFLGFGCLGLIIEQNWSQRAKALPSMDLSRVPIAMCAVMYSFEGINLVLPIEAAMKDPSKFYGIFVRAMATVTAIYAIFATLCIAAFGSIDNGSVTAFLMEHSDQYSAKSLVLAANFFVSFSVLVTYPLQLFPAINLVSQLRARKARRGAGGGGWVGVEHRRIPAFGEDGLPVAGGGAEQTSSLPQIIPGEEGGNTWQLTEREGPFGNRKSFEGDSPLLRAGLVLGTFVVAIVIPNVQELISLSGAFAGSSAALVIPPLIELKSLLEYNSKWAHPVVKCYILLAIGIVFLLLGTAASLFDIIKAFNEER